MGIPPKENIQERIGIKNADGFLLGAEIFFTEKAKKQDLVCGQILLEKQLSEEALNRLALFEKLFGCLSNASLSFFCEV